MGLLFIYVHSLLLQVGTLFFWHTSTKLTPFCKIWGPWDIESGATAGKVSLLFFSSPPQKLSDHLNQTVNQLSTLHAQLQSKVENWRSNT
jgi:hypothetical protein